MLASVMDWHICAAVSHLIATPPCEWPKTQDSLGRWFSKQGCTKTAACPISVQDLVIKTMSHLQPGDVLCEALTAFADDGSEPMPLGVVLVDEQLIADRAFRTARRLKHIPFLEWGDGPRKAWLQSQVWIAREVAPALLVVALKDKGIVVADALQGGGRVTYNFAVLLAFAKNNLLIYEGVIRHGLIRQKGEQKRSNLVVSDVSLEASYFDNLAKAAFCEWLNLFGCIHKWSNSSSIGVDIATISVPIVLQLKEELPVIICLLAGTTPPFITKMPGTLPLGLELKVLERKLGLRIVIKGEKVMCWLSIDALPKECTMNKLAGLEQRLLTAFHRSTSLLQYVFSRAWRRRVVAELVQLGLVSGPRTWPHRNAFCADSAYAEYDDSDGYDGVCLYDWDEPEPDEPDLREDFAPRTRNPRRTRQMYMQEKNRCKRLAHLAAKESREKTKREQCNAQRSRLSVRGGRHKSDPMLFVEGVDF